MMRANLKILIRDSNFVKLFTKSRSIKQCMIRQRKYYMKESIRRAILINK